MLSAVPYGVPAAMAAAAQQQQASTGNPNSRDAFQRYLANYDRGARGSAAPKDKMSKLDLKYVFEEGLDRGLTKSESATDVLNYFDSIRNQTKYGSKARKYLNKLRGFVDEEDFQGGAGDGGQQGGGGVLVGGLLGSVLGNIIQGRGAFDFGLNKPENDYVDLFPEFIPEQNPEALPKPNLNPDDVELMGGPNLLGGPDRSTPLEVIPFQQNQELVGPQSQVFPRFADPGNGTLNTTPMMTSQFGSLRNDLQSRLGFG